MDRLARAKAVRGLYPIVDVTEGMDARAAVARARAVAVRGVAVLQLRVKAMPDKGFHEIAAAVSAACAGLGLMLVINDRADIAVAVNAAGVHLGSDDLPLSAARRVLPKDAIVGRSTDTPEEARAAAEAGADYVAWGAVWPTATKTDAAPQEGPSALARVRAAIPGVPLVAIGGITAERAPLVRAAGADAFAVIGALRDAADPAAEAKRLADAWEKR
jgi:thiamine-phosphate pyrophosphorylase